MIEGFTKTVAYVILFISYIISIFLIPLMKGSLTGFITNPLLLFLASYGAGFAVMLFIIPKIVCYIMR